MCLVNLYRGKECVDDELYEPVRWWFVYTVLRSCTVVQCIMLESIVGVSGHRCRHRSMTYIYIYILYTVYDMLWHAMTCIRVPHTNHRYILWVTRYQGTVHWITRYCHCRMLAVQLHTVNSSTTRTVFCHCQISIKMYCSMHTARYDTGTCCTSNLDVSTVLKYLYNHII